MSPTRLRSVARKEVLHLRRDTRSLILAFLLPLLLTVLFGYAISWDVNDIETAVLDQDRSKASRELLDAFRSSGYFRLSTFLEDPREIKMLDRWKGGTLLLKPGRAGLQEKSIPVEAFFHKIVMLRDRLRVLEQKINANSGLSDADKVELQQFVTRIYGTLTTFNGLFADRDDWFVGQRSDGA